MIQLMYFLYDGSLNGDWVSRYVINLAKSSGETTIHLLHILDNHIGNDILNAKINLLESLFTSAGLKLEIHLFPQKNNILESILIHLPNNEVDSDLVICGTRIREKGRGFLQGTISEKLMKTGKFNVLAFRVVNPGLMGSPGTVLLPVSRDKEEITNSIYFLNLFSKDIKTLNILKTISMNPVYFSHLSRKKELELRHQASSTTQKILDELRERLTIHEDLYSIRTVITDDFPREIAIQANKTKSRLILLEYISINPFLGLFKKDPVELLLKKTPVDLALYQRAK